MKVIKQSLRVLSVGNAIGDRALWVGPVIYRTVVGSTPTADGSLPPTFTLTPIESPMPITPTPPTPMEAPTSIYSPTPAPGDYGAINGHALASKPVIVSLYDANNILIGSVAATEDGTFGLAALPGNYTVIATADGFLSAQGFVILTAGNTNILPTIHLLAGDIDHNRAIDQLDAMTIGMNYNMAFPFEADLNNDGIINVLDLEMLAKNYRKTGPVPWE